jgi:hypothetical protein
MKGYIYTMYAGADPGHGWVLNDPIFGKTPTLGACVPHIRRSVELGDFIFAISGRVAGEKQFVVGGFRVGEKIDALAAYERFPEHRMALSPDGHVLGNIIVGPDGKRNPIDNHTQFANRIENYIVGKDPIVLESKAEFDVARKQTVAVLSELFNKRGERVFDVIGRHRKMDESQINELLAWMRSIKQ